GGLDRFQRRQQRLGLLGRQALALEFLYRGQVADKTRQRLRTGLLLTAASAAHSTHSATGRTAHHSSPAAASTRCRRGRTAGSSGLLPPGSGIEADHAADHEAQQRAYHNRWNRRTLVSHDVSPCVKQVKSW